MNYLTYSYLLTPLHTGASSQAGNLIGIAREAQTEYPYIPSSSIRGKIRSSLESNPSIKEKVGILFGKRIQGDNQQPTEGEVWFADATLLLFPVASFSHQYVWITCPLWLSRWNRWLHNQDLKKFIEECRLQLQGENKKVVASVEGEQVFLQGVIIQKEKISSLDKNASYWNVFKEIPDGSGILNLKEKLIILADQDCAALVETGLQREVKICLEKDENNQTNEKEEKDKKVNNNNSFRSEEAIPSETVLFFPWGMKPNKDKTPTQEARKLLLEILNDRLQLGGLEGLGRGWTENKTVEVKISSTNVEGS